MSALATLSITAPLTAFVTPAVQAVPYRPQTLSLYANFSYGSGGTSLSAWIQTSHDGGLTWMDIANFTFATSSAKAIYNLSALTPRVTTAAITDGSLASNTTLDGILGALYRAKISSTGTYAAGTSLVIDASPGAARLTL
jgi:hypothetical protein